MVGVASDALDASSVDAGEVHVSADIA